jgi:hypothetical protein
MLERTAQRRLTDVQRRLITVQRRLTDVQRRLITVQRRLPSNTIQRCLEEESNAV